MIETFAGEDGINESNCPTILQCSNNCRQLISRSIVTPRLIGNQVKILKNRSKIGRDEIKLSNWVKNRSI